jgi:hypothetical protein
MVDRGPVYGGAGDTPSATLAEGTPHRDGVARSRPKDFTTVMAASAMKAMASSKVAMSAVVSFGGGPGAVPVGPGGARGLSPPRDAWGFRYAAVVPGLQLQFLLPPTAYQCGEGGRPHSCHCDSDSEYCKSPFAGLRRLGCESLRVASAKSESCVRSTRES